MSSFPQEKDKQALRVYLGTFPFSFFFLFFTQDNLGLWDRGGELEGGWEYFNTWFSCV